MKRAILFCVLAAGCAADDMSTTTQAAAGSCGELPATRELREWRGEPLYDPAAVRVATLAYPFDPAGHEFIAYGIDIDAGMVAFVMHGQREDLDQFLHDVAADIASPIAFKGGDGANPRPPGDPPDTDFLIAAATAAADAFSDAPSCSP